MGREREGERECERERERVRGEESSAGLGDKGVPHAQQMCVSEATSVGTGNR